MPIFLILKSDGVSWRCLEPWTAAGLHLSCLRRVAHGVSRQELVLVGSVDGRQLMEVHRVGKA